MNQRLISLDAFRGFTIAAMVVVNDPGSWSNVFGPLLHAEWNGATPTDYVFPFFLFIVGVSIALAYTKRKEANASKSEMIKKMVWRSLKIYLLGMFLWIFPDFDFSNLRWTGVLHRIAIVFLICGLLFLYTDWRKQIWIGLGILVGYWVFMAYVPIPGIGFPDLTVPEKNWANFIDKQYMPGYLWKTTWDPEGLLSTFPSIVTGITGMLVGKIIIDIKDQWEKLSYIFFAGLVMLTLGGIWKWWFPLNKNLWTSSYVMHTSGLAALALAGFILVVDIMKYQRWTFLGRVYGANSITSYALSSLLTVVFYKGLNEKWMEIMEGVVSAKMASFMYALIYMMIIFIPAYILYKRKIFIKV